MNLMEKFDNRVIIPLLIVIGIGAAFLFWRTGQGGAPGDYEVRTGNYRLEDGLFDQAEAEFKKALAKNPDHIAAHLALAITYMQTDRRQEALNEFNRTLELQPDNAMAYADRGILYDRMGEFEKALLDYRKSIALDERVTEGPGWLWRFMRNIDEKPPTLIDRANYIEAELEKPPEERLLKVPEIDSEQRMHKKSY